MKCCGRMQVLEAKDQRLCMQSASMKHAERWSCDSCASFITAHISDTLVTGH